MTSEQAKAALAKARPPREAGSDHPRAAPGGVPGRSKDRLTDVILAAFTEHVKTSGLKPGDRLPSEGELCRTYDVSRTVVREVIASMKARGLVDARRGSGLFVGEGSRDAMLTIDAQDAARIGEVLEVLELRLSVEVEAAALAAERRGDAALCEVREAQADFDAAMRAGDTGSRADFMFHRAIAAATGNRRFVQFLEGLETVLIPRKVLGAKIKPRDRGPAYLEMIGREHAAIADAIAARDVEAARAAMRLHLEGSRNRYRDWRLAGAPER
jgi:GntR family transcriptional regulator, transcriptional repressor for pyruvate dehydrogenase complex